MSRARAARPDQVSRALTVVVGSISDDPVDEAAEFQPFADILAERLSAQGIERGRVVVAASIPEMTELVRTGQVDLFFDSPFPALAVARDSGGTPFLRRSKGGVAEYHSVVFVRDDSGIDEPADLVGKKIGFDDEFSTSGFFVPAAVLAHRGLDLAQLPEATSDVPSRRVGYVFTDDDENTLFWVLEGRTEAGAMSESELRELAAADFEHLRIVATSDPMPRQLVVHGPRVAPALLDAVRTTLLEMHADRRGAARLDAFQGTTRFDELNPRTLAQLQGFLDQIPQG